MASRSITGRRRADAVELPETPVPTEVEFELTNRCNASCVACPRTDMPGYGRMEQSTLDRILDGYDEGRADHPLNIAAGALRYPYVTFAGGGDPLLHPHVAAFASHIGGRGYGVHLITNGAAASPERVEQLVASGLQSIACSFWGIVEREYEAAMRLPYRRTLERVEHLAATAAAAGIPFTVTWVRVPEVTSDAADIARFWDDRGIDVDLSDNTPWNRGGLLSLDAHRSEEPSLKRPDPERRVWCADLYFSDAWTWDGRCVLCCCNYFTSTPHVIAEPTVPVREVAERKRVLIDHRPLPRMCTGCLQPRTNQATWLAEPWRRLMHDGAWDELTYASPDGAP